MNLQADAADRLAIYQRLYRRNRLVAMLRIGVPMLGVITLVGLLGQIYLSSLGGRFGVGRIAVTQDTVTVQTPEYAGLLDDGSAYRVWATEAEAAIDATDIIDLTDAALVVDRVSGVSTQAQAAAAQLDTSRQLVVIDGMAQMEDSTGTKGTFSQSVFDWAKQSLTAQGRVNIDYTDGATLEAEGMVYDAKALIWTFTKATVTLPETPSGQPEKADSP